MSNSNTSLEGTQQCVRSLGPYDILHTIGKGNFSIVKLALHRETNYRVAIKCVSKKDVDSGDLVRFYRECEIMKSLDHPHIIKLLKIMESKSMLFLVCEYASNGELFEYISKYGAMSERMARSTFSQIISAVEYCHNKNIVHRDLKSENLLLDHNMNIKVTDFGFANYFDNFNPLKTLCGSPQYAAPEIFAGKTYYGPEVDIWSLGVVLYVLVCGTLPFYSSDNLQQLKKRVLHCNYKCPNHVSTDCTHLLSHILVVSASKRYKLPQIKSHKWLVYEEKSRLVPQLRAKSSSLKIKFFHIWRNKLTPPVIKDENTKNQQQPHRQLSIKRTATQKMRRHSLTSISLPLFVYNSKKEENDDHQTPKETTEKEVEIVQNSTTQETTQVEVQQQELNKEIKPIVEQTPHNLRKVALARLLAHQSNDSSGSAALWEKDDETTSTRSSISSAFCTSSINSSLGIVNSSSSLEQQHTIRNKYNYPSARRRHQRYVHHHRLSTSSTSSTDSAISSSSSSSSSFYDNYLSKVRQELNVLMNEQQPHQRVIVYRQQRTRSNNILPITSRKQLDVVNEQQQQQYGSKTNLVAAFQNIAI